MGDIQTRPFSKDYSGLINQSVIAASIAIICVTSHEIMKRRRRGKRFTQDLGSRESWEFGYLFQGRCWARYPSPPSPAGWPLSWIGEVMNTSEDRLNELCGVDAALYVRFLRGCFWFTFLHTLTTFPVLFPIHLRFSDASVSPTSMTRASISSLVSTSKGLSLLWIHILLLFWITLTWFATLCWVCLGAFRLRQAHLYAMASKLSLQSSTGGTLVHSPHPHPPYTFTDVPLPDEGYPNVGLRSRTIMVSNVPRTLRNEKELKDYFTYYMSQEVEKSSIGWTFSPQLGLLNKCCTFLFNRLKRRATNGPTQPLAASADKGILASTCNFIEKNDDHNGKFPFIERITIGRRMTELASLMERREDILSRLEAAHIALANNVLLSVKAALDRKLANGPLVNDLPGMNNVMKQEEHQSKDRDVILHERDGNFDEEDHMSGLIDTLAPYVEEFGLRRPLVLHSKKVLCETLERTLFPLFRLKRNPENSAIDQSNSSDSRTLSPSRQVPDVTIWEALLSLPRSSLDAYQPLVSLSHVFRGRTVPAIDYYTMKLEVINTRIIEKRSKPDSEYEPVSTAFVTFAKPPDARRACKYLAVHPKNPLACLVTMAPAYEDLDWMCVMKSSFNSEFVKDWVVNIGIWGFTLFWLFPVSLLVGLVSIQNISRFWPTLKSYLDRHAWQGEIIQSFLPTMLVSLLALLIPVILFFIAKAHTITTLSALHDLILTRYYKFLVVNVLVFFCVGTAALQSFLLSFSAGPFYVGWLIFSTAIHGCFELALVGLPLLTYPSTRRQITPRKRAVDIRPCIFPYYYWIPNHLLVLHTLLLFSILNPFVLPFGALYFLIQTGVVKNQFIYVYGKVYEGNGQLILIRIVRYSLDGLVLAQAVFLAYMVVLKKPTNVGLAAFLVASTVITKLMLTRICRAQFDLQDTEKSEMLDRRNTDAIAKPDTAKPNGDMEKSEPTGKAPLCNAFSSLKLSSWFNFSVEPTHGTRNFGFTGATPPRLSPNENFRHAIASTFVPSPTEALPQPATSPSTAQHAPQVIPHPALGPWDDQTMVDRPYNNPFYSRPIDNFLWLPRNPCGVLDLDDTVDLRIPLGIQVSEIVSPTEPPREAETTPLFPGLTGSPPSDEIGEVELSGVNIDRIKSRESFVQHKSKPSIIHYQASGHDSTSPREHQSPAANGRPPHLNGRSLSDGIDVRPPQTSQRASLQFTSSIFRTRSADIERGIRRPIVYSNAKASEDFSRPQDQRIPAHRAIAHEVLAEEDMIKQLEEKVNEDKAKTTKSWLTSWMFTKAE